MSVQKRGEVVLERSLGCYLTSLFGMKYGYGFSKDDLARYKKNL